MNDHRNWLALAVLAVLSGCVSTPSTKALITPVGAVGVYSFAPTDRRSPDDIEAARAVQARLARVEGDQDHR